MKWLGFLLIIWLISAFLVVCVNFIIENILTILIVVLCCVVLMILCLLIIKRIKLLRYKKNIINHSRRYDEIKDYVKKEVNTFFKQNRSDFLNINVYYFIPEYKQYNMKKNKIDFLIKSKIKILSKIKNKNEYINQMISSLKYIQNENNCDLFKAFQLIKKEKYFTANDIKKMLKDIDEAKNNEKKYLESNRFTDASESKEIFKQLNKKLKYCKINNEIYLNYKIINDIYEKILRAGVISDSDIDKSIVYVIIQVEIDKRVAVQKEIVKSKYSVSENDSLEIFTRKLYNSKNDVKSIYNKYRMYQHVKLKDERIVYEQIEKIIKCINIENINNKLIKKYNISENESIESFTKKLYEADVNYNKISDYYLAYVNDEKIKKEEVEVKIKGILSSIKPNNMYFAYGFSEEIKKKYIKKYNITNFDNEKDATKKIVNGFLNEISIGEKIFKELDKVEGIKKLLINFSSMDENWMFLVKYLPFFIINPEKNKRKYVIYELSGKIKTLQSLMKSKTRDLRYATVLLSVYNGIKKGNISLKEEYIKPITIIKNEKKSSSFISGTNILNNNDYRLSYRYDLSEYKRTNNKVIQFFQDILLEKEFVKITKDMSYSDKLEIFAAFIYYYALKKAEGQRDKYIRQFELKENDSEMVIIEKLCKSRVVDDYIIQIVKFVRGDIFYIDSETEGIRKNLDAVKKELQRQNRLKKIAEGFDD